MRPPRFAPLADAAVVVVFLLIGRRSHGLEQAGSTWFLEVLWPIAVAWIVGALALRLYTAAERPWLRLVGTVVVTVTLGGLLRHFTPGHAMFSAFNVVLAIGLLMWYALTGFGLALHSVLLAHMVFGTAFVAAVVRTRLGHVDPSLEEASRDLGATPVATFFLVTIPSLAPAIVAGALLVFTLSLDEFVIAFFTDGPKTPTLPIVVYSMVRFGLTPEVNALAAILLVVTFTVIISAQRLTGLGGARE
mgnify:CR=1 FL=1